MTPQFCHGCRRGPTGRELRQWASLARTLCQRGHPVTDALAAAWHHTYVAVESSTEGRAAAAAAFARHCARASANRPADAPHPLSLSLSAPAAWPLAGSVAELAADSRTAVMAAEAAVLGHLACQVIAAEVACSGGSGGAQQARTPFGAICLPAPLLAAHLLGAYRGMEETNAALVEAVGGVSAAQRGLAQGLQLLWQAAACFAERAAAEDWRARLQCLDSLQRQVRLA